MGTLTYQPACKEIEIEDRVLAHVQAVVIAKLRRGESFAFNWTAQPDLGNGRTTVWIHPAIFLEFTFLTAPHPPLNRAWIEELLATANSGPRFELVDEPAPTPTSQAAP